MRIEIDLLRGPVGLRIVKIGSQFLRLSRNGISLLGLVSMTTKLDLLHDSIVLKILETGSQFL